MRSIATANLRLAPRACFLRGELPETAGTVLQRGPEPADQHDRQRGETAVRHAGCVPAAGRHSD